MVFALLAFSIYLGMNVYVLTRLVRLFEIPRSGWFYPAVLAMTLSLFAALILETRVGNRATGVLFTLALTWFGLCWILLWLLPLQQILGLFLRLPPRVWAAAVSVVVCGIALYAAINAQTITVRREQIHGVPLRIAHLSDIHIGSIGPRTLGEIVAKTNALRPDLILITGDLVDNATPKTRALISQLNALAAPVFFTSGNHEVYTGYGNVRRMLADTSIRWLRNEAITFQGMRVIGVDNSYGTELLQGVLERTPSSPEFTVLMNHQPMRLDLAARHGIALTLSGHVHNGQIWPFNYIVGLFYPYLKGLHESGGVLVNVSTGTGIWGPPMRLGSHSEIVLLEPLK